MFRISIHLIRTKGIVMMNQTKQYNDLTNGNITETLLKLTMPILGSSLLMMLHNLIDMFCVSRLGSAEVSAAGTGGFFIWLAMSLSALSRIGAQIKVSHAVGQKDFQTARRYVESGIFIAFIMGIFLAVLLLTFKNSLIAFFHFRDKTVVSLSIDYITVVGFAMPFFFLNPVLSAIFQGAGNSRLPFTINLSGLGANILLNFILIFGLGPIPALGVHGAALATSFSQALMTFSYLFVMLNMQSVFLTPTFSNGIDWKRSREILLMGLPYGIQETLFTIISIVIARFVSPFGNSQIAAQKLGSQIEAISWESSSGFSAALTAFVGQNYTAGKKERIWKGYRNTICFSATIGLIAFLLFFFFGKQIFLLFFPSDLRTVEAGNVYLKILSYSQIMMCIEITTSGLFNGIGKTHIPSIIGIVFTALRIPFAYILCQPEYLGVEGIWWVTSVSSIIKGLVALTVYLFYKNYKQHAFVA